MLTAGITKAFKKTTWSSVGLSVLPSIEVMRMWGTEQQMSVRMCQNLSGWSPSHAEKSSIIILDNKEQVKKSKSVFYTASCKKVSDPTHCCKQAKLEQVVQSGFECVQERRLCNLSGPLCQYLNNLTLNMLFQISNGGIPHATACVFMSAFSSDCPKPAIRQSKTTVMSSLSLPFQHLSKPTSLSYRI